MDSDFRSFVDLSQAWKRKMKMLDELEVNLAKNQVSFQFLQSGHIKFKEDNIEQAEFYKVVVKIQVLLHKMKRNAENLKDTKGVDAFDFIDEYVKRVKKLLKDYEVSASVYTHRWVTNLMYNTIIKEDTEMHKSLFNNVKTSTNLLPNTVLNSKFDV